MTAVRESVVVKVSLARAWLPCRAKTLDIPSVGDYLATRHATAVTMGPTLNGFFGTGGSSGIQTFQSSDGKMQDNG